MMNPIARSIEELVPSSSASSNHLFIFIRTALIISSLCAAFVLPFFGIVMSLVGSLFSVLMAVVLPSLCFIKIMGAKAKRTQLSCIIPLGSDLHVMCLLV
ncbi:hypothetical protein LIER_40597 [Lithospermum erythrorhizon]|uniref:Amino acid transporter transmembrane domain-containing protein n=1 Tax=Lithospermum erythrorhizon TaxID=34254 RepID=A0AAV3R099_LITER